MARTMVQYEKVLEVLKAADVEPVMLEELKEKCEAAGVFMYRISSYMWDIKTKTSYGVMPIKDGRKCVGYKLVGNGIGASKAQTTEATAEVDSQTIDTSKLAVSAHA